MQTPDVPDLIQQFALYLQNERRLSPYTVACYRADLARLHDFCRRHGIDGWDALAPAEVRRYVTELHRSGLSGRSIQRLLSAARTFYRYLLRENRARHNPVVGIPVPKSPRRLPDALSPDEAARLVAIPTEDAPAFRDRALLELLYSSGLRLSELVSLNVDALQPDDGTVTVIGKGRKERVVPVGTAARSALNDWLNKRPTLAAIDERALFIGRNGRRLSARVIQTRVAYWARRQGLARPVHPHMLRHSFASHVLESSGDLRAVQELLGHANIATTQIYTHLDFQHLAKVYDQAHPRARRKNE